MKLNFWKLPKILFFFLLFGINHSYAQTNPPSKSPVDSLSLDSSKHHKQLPDSIKFKPKINPINIPKTDSSDLKSRFFPKKFDANIKKDTSSKQNSLKSKIGFTNDSTKRKFPLSKLNTKGTVSLGYDYGVIPFIVNGKTPSGYFKTEGNIGFEAFKIPLIASFYYADVKNVSGLNNYFRITFDENQFKENFKRKTSVKEFAAKDQLNKLYLQRQQLDQKLLYLKSIQAQPNLNQPNMSLYGNINDLSLNDSLHIPNYSLDSLSSTDSHSTLDTSKTKNHYLDSLSQGNDNLQKADSIKQKIESYEQQLSETKEKIEETQKLLALLQNPDASQYIPGNSKPSLMNIFSYVKKLEIGLCYPNYSSFLINGSAVKGINLEMQKRSTFFAFTYGKTINNLMFSNNIVQNNLQNTRNLYNFFDFNNVKDSRRIAAIKIGYGGKDETHLHVGLLYGIGQSSYIANSDLSSNPTVNKERNYVFEVDGKAVINQNNSIDLSYGKSSIQQDNVSYPDAEKGFAGIFNSNIRSNAALAKYNLLIPVTKSKLTFSSRLIDPFFRSYGVGFIRSDNFRYEAKLDQPLTKKIKIGASYRKDQDNILNMYLVKTTLQTIGSSITFRVTKQLTIRASYNPVLQKVRSKDNSIQFDNRNYISNAIITWTPKLKKINSSFNALYNYYRLYDGVRNNVYENYALTNVTTAGIFKNELSGNYFKTNNSDSLTGNTVLMTNYVSLMFKKIMITGGIKWAQSKVFNDQVGYKLKVNIPLNKYFSVEASGEKIVLGDFYNSYAVGQLDKFPYYCYAKIIINW